MDTRRELLELSGSKKNIAEDGLHPAAAVRMQPQPNGTRIPPFGERRKKKDSHDALVKMKESAAHFATVPTLTLLSWKGEPMLCVVQLFYSSRMTTPNDRCALYYNTYRVSRVPRRSSRAGEAVEKELQSRRSCSREGAATAREFNGEHLVPATQPAPVFESEECLVPRPQEQIAVAPRQTLPRIY